MYLNTLVWKPRVCIGRLLISGRGVVEQHNQPPSILITWAGLKEGNFISRKIIHARWADDDDSDVHLETFFDGHASRRLPLTDSAAGGRRKATLQNHAWMKITSNTRQNHNRLIQNHLSFHCLSITPPILHNHTISSLPLHVTPFIHNSQPESNSNPSPGYARSSSITPIEFSILIYNLLSHSLTPSHPLTKLAAKENKPLVYWPKMQLP